ncbi:DUF4817 domain-containing protein [Trichonephila clavipes]|nr:DUF4817 domain-containing protein [Trichonephila clavipes]
MSRCPKQVVSLKRDPQCLGPKTNLVLIHRPTEKFKLAILSKMATDLTAVKGFILQFVYVETSLHPEKLTVWCALWAGGIIGLYFFKNDEGHNITANGDRYRAMITNFFIPELNNQDVQELWFQQDGATCHTARATLDLLKYTFGDRLILRFGPVNWPPRSCDLTPLDYFLWSYVKSLVYTDKPQTLDHFEENICRVIADIGPQCWKKSSKIGRPDWTTSEPAVAVLYQKSYVKCIQSPRLEVPYGLSSFCLGTQTLTENLNILYVIINVVLYFFREQFFDT